MLMHPNMPEENREIEIPNNIMMLFYASFLALGIVIYISWGLMYGSWNIFARTNLGIYATTVILCGFGLVGMMLYHIKGKENNQ